MIVGLGNPGAEYRGTRHNVGFEVIDRLAARHKLRVTVSRERALTGVGSVRGVPVLLVKPMTFMNLSGQSVGALARRHGFKPEQVLVVADDLDLPTGRVRMKPKGSSGGHNGHKSILAALRSEEYPRIKIGIGKDGPTIDHVLSRFAPEERTLIDAAIERAADGCETFLVDGLERALNVVNSG